MERLRDPARAGGESGGSRLGVKVEEKGGAACDLNTSAKNEATLGETRRNNLRCSKQQAPATVVFRGLTFELSGSRRQAAKGPE